MLLAHLIPFLDAEIDRLQQARDLLAYVPPSLGSTVSNPFHADQSTLLSADAVNSASIQPPGPASALPVVPVQVAPMVMVIKPYRRGAERGPRRKAALTLDTALRGAVPAGPVVVSAQAVRQAQESKVTQASKGAAETVPTIDWRPRANGAPDVEAQLLRKLLDIGTSKDTTHGSPSEQLLRFMHS